MTDDSVRDIDGVEEDDRGLQERGKDDFEYDARHHKYFLDGREMTGCTTVLGVIAKPALIQWAANEAVKFIKDNVVDENIDDSREGDHYLLTVQDDVLEQARTAHTRKRDDAAQKGTDTHALVEQFIKRVIAAETREEVEVDERIEPFAEWAAREKIRFLASEQQVYSRSLFVAGTFDFMFEKDGKRYVGDLKTYKKLYDRIPVIQCAGYSIMYEEMQHGYAFERAKAKGFDDKTAGLNSVGMPRIDGYCIFNLPKERPFDEQVDVVWSWDTEGDREAFIAAVRLYRYLQEK